MVFAARILPITAAARVPNADRLTVYRILGYDAVSANEEDGSQRFAVGERVVYVPEGSLIPDDLLHEHGFWGMHPQFGREMGLLSSANGNVVKPLTLRGQLSTGLLWKLPAAIADLPDGSDVSAHFGIVEYVPPVPRELLEIAMPLTQARLNYEIGRLKMYPDLLAQDEVVVTEKLEGECLQMTWFEEPVEGLFGRGHVAVTTKGLAAQGLVFRDVPKAHNVPIVRAMQRAGLLSSFRRMVERLDARNRKVRLLAEAIGAGVKKLHYGESTPDARAFDVRVDERWLPEDERADALGTAGIVRVPVLWRGQYDPERIETLRNGMTTLVAAHIREGVVINAVGEQNKRLTALGDQMRPILKSHGDAFLKKFGRDD